MALRGLSLNLGRLRGWRTGLALGDRLVTSFLVRWTWTGLKPTEYAPGFTDFRPADRESVGEMMAGRYLLASRLVDTHGSSPFALDDVDDDWRDELHSYSWLRHFRDHPDETGRRLAQTLVMEWIARYGNFDRHSWGIKLCAQRVMNWLRHFPLISEGASVAQVEMVSRSISLQVQCTRLRARLSSDPDDQVWAAILMLGAALSDGSADDLLHNAADHLCRELGKSLDADGLHLSRNAAQQVEFLVELITLRQGLTQRSGDADNRLGALVDKMLLALSGVMMGTGEPGYFNGCGQTSTDILLAVQMQGSQRRMRNSLTGGYGLIRQGDSVVMLDSGRVPPPVYAQHAHASALAIEFSSGNQLVVGNCGPAPVALRAHRDAFRQAVAHSAPSIDGLNQARIGRDGVLYAVGEPAAIEVSDSEAEMIARSFGFRGRYGIALERRISLISDGDTLVGRDKMVSRDGRAADGRLTLSFHLGPGISVEDRIGGQRALRLVGRQGQAWNFLWEGAEATVEDSVRQSSHFGFHQTKQIRLTRNVEPGAEVVWLFTLQN